MTTTAQLLFQNEESTVKHRYVAIMAGGSGERFWPLSRRAHPKQLLKLPGSDKTMLGDTIDRVRALVPFEKILILTAPHLADVIRRAEPDMAAENVLSEPVKRNTAGCLCWLAANLMAQESDPSEVTLAVLAADHKISPIEAFHETVAAAMALAENNGALVTIGIRPDRPETGYGYIEADLTRPVESYDGCTSYLVNRFHEKPSADLATEYVATEGFYWNSGMFFWRLDTFLSELKRVAAPHFKVVNTLSDLIKDGNLKEAERIFASLPDISIDYLLMERASHVAVVEATFDWDDVGSWDAVSRYMIPDSRGNSSLGDNVLVQTADCMVHNESQGITVALAGVYDLLVVVTDDAVLVCDNSQTQSVREIVSKLTERGSTKL